MAKFRGRFGGKRKGIGEKKLELNNSIKAFQSLWFNFSQSIKIALLNNPIIFVKTIDILSYGNGRQRRRANHQ